MPSDKIRILIADDEPEFRLWLAGMLKASDNYEVVGIAESGKEAIRQVEQFKPDLAIIDIYMPDMDGLEVARHVKASAPDVNVILVSAQEDRAYQRLADDEGAVAFIPKVSLTLERLRQL